MTKGRLEAFSDGVIAIIITIMVLEMKVPHGAAWADLVGLWPVFLSYLLSFTNVGIYWSNHHHMLQAATHVSGGVLWANLHLLFWLSLLPFVTAWMGENHFAPNPVMLYGVDLVMCAIAYSILQYKLISLEGRDSRFARALGSDVKGLGSLAAYVIAIPIAFFLPRAALAIYFIVAVVWLIPDRRFERTLNAND